MRQKGKEFFKIILAGVKIEIEIQYRYVFYKCRDYLGSFEQPDFVIRTTNDDIITARSIHIKEMNPIPGIAVCYADDYTESFVVFRKIVNQMIHYDTILMHGSVVALDGEAYMFTAASGVGKSTRARIFRDIYPTSIVVNGDKPLIKITDAGVMACGTPWCGKEGWNTNTIVPLKAIFLLDRAEEGENTSIEEISLGKAFPFLLQQTYRPEDADLMRQTLQLLKSLEGKVKIYKFRSTPTEESVRLAYTIGRSK